MEYFIGERLEVVLNYLAQKGLKYEVIDNNFSVDGDTRIVTNIKEVNGIVYITTGNFIFNLENK